jgi:hypothetical protein
MYCRLLIPASLPSFFFPGASIVSRYLNGIHDLLISSAPTQVTAQCFSDCVPRGIGISSQQRFSGDDHAGGAKAALDRALLYETTLQVVGFTGFCAQSFDRYDRSADNLWRHDHAAVDHSVVQQHGASAAFTDVAALFGAC